MIAVASFFVVLVISLIVVRVASVALQQTGMSAPMAKFQARSAWTGTGFTTAESERVVKHPVRRRIVSWLMVLRSAGLVTAATALVVSFSTARGTEQSVERLLMLLAGLVLLWIVSLSSVVDRQLTRVIRWALRRYSDIDVRDYASLFRLAGGYSVSELEVKEDGWLADRSLSGLDLPEEGVLVLGVSRRDGTYLGAPRGKTVLHPGDVVTLYGRAELIEELDRRRADLSGVASRVEAVEEQDRIEAAEEAMDAGENPEEEGDRHG